MLLVVGLQTKGLWRALVVNGDPFKQNRATKLLLLEILIVFSSWDGKIYCSDGSRLYWSWWWNFIYVFHGVLYLMLFPLQSSRIRYQRCFRQRRLLTGKTYFFAFVTMRAFSFSSFWRAYFSRWRSRQRKHLVANPLSPKAAHGRKFLHPLHHLISSPLLETTHTFTSHNVHKPLFCVGMMA